MSTSYPTAVTITVESLGPYDSHSIWLSGRLVGYRPYDGSSAVEVTGEVLDSLAALLRERLGWAADIPEEKAWQ